ncbi:MAG TPA: hypothetical protein VIM11_15405 [Tepidisphaeraceae bacterium]|jgi:hypothetical protein
MAASKWLVGIGAVVLGAALVTGQQQQQQQQQNTTTPQRQTRARLTSPWTQIKDLSDDTKSKIIELRRKSVEERAVISAKERSDIMALLSDAQKKEVTDYEAQNPRRGGRRGAATTRPAGTGTGQ